MKFLIQSEERVAIISYYTNKPTYFPIWQYGCDEDGSGAIRHYTTHKEPSEFDESVEVDVLDETVVYKLNADDYAAKRFMYLAEHNRQWLYDTLSAGELVGYAERFEEEMNEKVSDLFVSMKDNNPDYKKAQALGDFELAAGLANTDMETAKQVIMNDYVYAL